MSASATALPAKGEGVEDVVQALVGPNGIQREFAARTRRARPPEPYKGKGVRYYGEHIAQKAGKSFVGGEK